MDKSLSYEDAAEAQYDAHNFWPQFFEEYSKGGLEGIGSLELLDGYAGKG